ncbi:MAG: 3-dehydroquinate synthase [Conexibacter sp.]|jgi:3-dehydroquinate synthase|nr:3-dehydroquinate synthase [Conexibacter sp.]
MGAALTTAARDTQLSAAFTVAYDYAVHFTRDALDPANAVLAQAFAGDGVARVLVVIDSGVLAHHGDLPQRLRAYAAHHADRLALAGEPLVLPGGEEAKQDPAHAQAVLDAINARGIDRHAYVLGIGGGAVLDAAGYGAAVAHRGVRMVRMPTTVLAQNDAGIGVKNGINAYGKKNFLGAFAPPVAVVNDELFLTTLSDADWRAGTSEAVKVALLKDAAFFGELERRAPALLARDLEAMAELVQRCAALHVAHITGAGDPFELGSSRPLDFGHWSGHKLEQLSATRLRHGEAVAIGIALDSTYAQLAGLLPVGAWRRVLALFDALGLPVTAPELSDPRLLDGLGEFREHLGGRLTVTLIEGIGAGLEVHEIDHDLMRLAITRLGEAAASGGAPTIADGAAISS